MTYRGDVAALREAGLDTGFDSGGVVSGLIPLRDLERLAAVPSVISIATEPRLKAGLDGTVKELRVPWKVPPTTPWPGKGAGVIVAVVDSGIDIFHDSFRNADHSTRILELWDQGATTGGSAPPAGFAQIGRVYSRNDIRDGLAAGPPFASVDTTGHGTHVAGIAGGDGSQDDRCSSPGRYVGVAPEADLVIVKTLGVPNRNNRDALRWCAQAGSRHPGATGNKPVVINISFGTDAGPHDGTGRLDGFVDELLRPASGPPAGLAIVVLAGNSGDKAIHERGSIPGGGTVTISFYVPDGSKEGDTLDIWYNGTATLNIELIAPPNPSVPGSNTTGTITPGAAGSPFTIGRMTLDVFSATAPMADHNNRKEIRVDFSTPPDAALRPELWQLKLTETAGVPADWDAWFDVETGDAYPTFRLPSESAPVPRRSENTLWEPGTSRNAITVASYEDDGDRAESSSHGPPNQAAPLPVGEFKPTVAAPGVSVAAPRSQNDPKSNSSCCDQKVIDKSGTSMATPHVTGLVALMFQRNRTLTFEQVRAHLQHSARIDGIPTAEVPPIVDAATGIRANALWGSGKVNAAVALAEMPAMPGGGGGGGGGSMTFDTSELGYTPHNLVSRLGEWRNRFGPRPGLMLFAVLVSEHVDEVLRLVNKNPRVGAVWRRRGGPLLVRRLLYGPPPSDTLLPRAIDGCDVADLVARFLAILDRFGGPRLKADVARFGEFATLWPGGDLARLDAAAREFEPAI